MKGYDKKIGRLQQLKSEMAADRTHYDRRLIVDQREYPAWKGSYGPIGSVKRNGCGSIALHNLMCLCGIRGDYGRLLLRMNREWRSAMLLGGCMGTNPCYIFRYLKSTGSLNTKFYFVMNERTAERIDRSHRAYLNLYLHRGGAHYTVSRFHENGFEIYNDVQATDYQDYFRRSGALFMFVVGID